MNLSPSPVSKRQHGRPRKYPYAAVGDRFGTRVVTRLLRRDRTGNERVVARCEVCGARAVAYVFNLRQRPGCRHCPRKGDQ